MSVGASKRGYRTTDGGDRTPKYSKFDQNNINYILNEYSSTRVPKNLILARLQVLRKRVYTREWRVTLYSLRTLPCANLDAPLLSNVH